MIFGSILFLIALIILIIYIINYNSKNKPIENRNTEIKSDFQIVEKNLNSEKNKIITQKRVDLHHYKRDFNFLNKYIEFSFYACFYDIFNINDDDSLNNDSSAGNGLKNLFFTLGIDYDFSLILKKYMDRDYRDADVFKNRNDENTFIYLDLEQEKTDQNNMFLIGVSCLKNKSETILSILKEIHKSSDSSTEFIIDCTNSELYYKIYHSYFHFYNGNYNESKKQIKHN